MNFLNIMAPPRLDVGSEDFSMVLVGLVEWNEGRGSTKKKNAQENQRAIRIRGLYSWTQGHYIAQTSRWPSTLHGTTNNNWTWFAQSYGLQSQHIWIIVEGAWTQNSCIMDSVRANNTVFQTNNDSPGWDGVEAYGNGANDVIWCAVLVSPRHLLPLFSGAWFTRSGTIGRRSITC